MSQYTHYECTYCFSYMYYKCVVHGRIVRLLSGSILIKLNVHCIILNCYMFHVDVVNVSASVLRKSGLRTFYTNKLYYNMYSSPLIVDTQTHLIVSVSSFIHLIIIIILQQCGDIELNPGPDTELNLAHVNARSVYSGGDDSKLGQLLTQAIEFNWSAIGVSETCLTPMVPDHLVSLQGFASPERNDRVHKRRGGVMIYCSRPENLKSYVISVTVGEFPISTRNKQY